MIVEVANTCDFITTSSECEVAAQYLGLSDTSAAASSNKGSHDPPYCYIEGGSLQFNSGGTNTGECGDLTHGSGQYYDECLCKSPTTTTTTTTSTTTATTTTTTGEERNVPVCWQTEVLNIYEIMPKFDLAIPRIREMQISWDLPK